MDIHINLDGRGQISRRVYRQIREAIIDGRLRAGETLPSSRELAHRLEVSRNVVVVAYEYLHAEGFLTTRVGAGTYVSDHIRQRSPRNSSESPLRPRRLWSDIPEGPDMSSRPDFDFRPGIPDADKFPFASWRGPLSRQLHRRAVGTGAHIGAAGHPELRAAIARHVGLSRAVRATADDIFVTNGSQQAIDLIARVLLEPGETVAVEDPGYPLPRRAYHVHGCEVVGVPVDDDGLVVDAIPEKARLVYVTPSHQYPLGMTLSMGRRQALLEWADRADATIVEDDYDSEFRYGGRPLESLHSLDASGRVLYVGSFSKTTIPTLRLGFAVIPAPLHAAFRKAKHLSDWHTAVPLQAAAAQFIEGGHLARHIRRMRRVYAERHDRIMSILVRDFAEHLTPIASHCGLHLAAFFDGSDGHTDLAIVERARTRGVALMPLSHHFVATSPRPGLLLGYGAIPSERIDEGLHRLRQLVQSMRA